MLVIPPAKMIRPSFRRYALNVEPARQQEPLVLPREHVDNVHLTGISVVGSEHVRYRFPERLAEESVMHQDDARVIRHLPVNDAGGDGFDNPSSLPVTETLDITLGHHGQLAVDLDTDDARVRELAGDQQGFALARSEIDECSGVRQFFEHPRERGPLASQVRPVFGAGVVGIDFGSNRTDSFGAAVPVKNRCSTRYIWVTANACSLPPPRRSQANELKTIDYPRSPGGPGLVRRCTTGCHSGR